MKQLLTILCLLILVSCSPEPKEVSSDQLVERQGITYEVNSQTPFTGGKVSYHDNNQLKTKGNYIDGKRDGLWENFFSNGQLSITSNYKNGKQDGLQEIFYENGQLKMKGNLKDGKLDGLWEDFYSNGQLESRGNLMDGKLDGLREYYHENGSIESYCYKNGEEVDMSYCEK